MVNLLYTEFLKLKRSKMFLVSIVGATSVPILAFLGFLQMRAQKPDVPMTFSDAFSETNLYIIAIIGALLYGVITSYIFNREYTEDTLKNLLTIPVSRTSFIVSKLFTLFIWIIILTLISWALTLSLGLIAQFENLNTTVLRDSFTQYMIGGMLLFLLSTPTIFITLLFKNYVPTIIFTTIITMGNAMILNSKYRALYPWTAITVITGNRNITRYPVYYSFIAIFITSIIGLLATIIYFRKVDIN